MGINPLQEAASAYENRIKELGRFCNTLEEKLIFNTALRIFNEYLEVLAGQLSVLDTIKKGKEETK